MQHFHYIFTGGGLSSLMLLYHFFEDEYFNDKTILIIDPVVKNTNDRTWCFWEKTDLFDDIAEKIWKKSWFKNGEHKQLLTQHPYLYKKIRSQDFYNFVQNQAKQKNNIQFLQDEVVDFQEMSQHCFVKTKNHSFTCNQIFNSIYNPNWVANQEKFPLIQQHFLGWVVRTKEPVFTVNYPTLMDFSVAQKHNTRFMYVLPNANNEALVEYTLFSKQVLPREEYEEAIQIYLKDLGVTEYDILEKEKGIIPMTSYPFWQHNSKNILHIGSAGGWTKASTGYTFKNAYKKAQTVTRFINSNSNLDFSKLPMKNRFWFYDLLLIDILYQKNAIGSKIFSALFEDGKTELVFKFLDEETTLIEDLKVIWRCPKGIFIKALLKRLNPFVFT